MLGIPSRIIVRTGKFRADNFNSFIKNSLQIPFELFLAINRPIKIRTSSRKSKLIHTGAIEERLEKVIKERLDSKESLISQDETENPDVFVRISRDTVTISIDSSGTPLYKRGLKKYIADAPIRETIANAAILKSHFTSGQPFIDPMSGSGTFSMEAAIIATNTPPGIFRKFAFESWPMFSREQFLKLSLLEKSQTIPSTSFIFAGDIEEKNIHLLNKNISDTHLSDSIARACFDFFNLRRTSHQGTIAINPPYGMRIHKEKELISGIESKLKKDFKGWNLIFTIPVQMGSQFFSKKNFDKTGFVHGGIDMSLLTGKV